MVERIEIQHNISQGVWRIFLDNWSIGIAFRVEANAILVANAIRDVKAQEDGNPNIEIIRRDV